MDMKNLEYFTAIAETGSLSAAARRLGVSQPTLSSYLSNLEMQLGIDLFLRERKVMVPTPAGRIYLDAARRLIGLKAQTWQSIRALNGRPEEIIRFGGTPYRGAVAFSQILPSFVSRYPQIHLDLHEGYLPDLQEMLRQGDLDLAMGTCPDSDLPGLTPILSNREEVVLCAPAFHRMASHASRDPDHLTSVDIRDFSDTPFIQMHPGNTIRAISDSLFAQAGIRPTVVFNSNNNLVVNTLVRQGFGFGMVPRATMTIAEEDIVYFSLSPKYFINLCVLVRRGRTLSAPERYLVYLVLTLSAHQEHSGFFSYYNDSALKILKEFSV